MSVQEAAQVDLNVLARATIKIFERLAPFSQLQTSPSVEAPAVVNKIVKKVTAYLQAIDSSILSVQIAHRLSRDAVALCNLAVGEDDQDSSLTLISTESERRKRLNGLLRLADDAHEKAQKTKEAFREVEQDLYKIAASTKDNTSVIQIPVDPARPKTIQRPLKDIGSDLVANLGVLMEFSGLTSQLADWRSATKADLDGGGLSSTLTEVLDGTDSVAQLRSIRTQWTAVRDDTSAYHKMIENLQTHYADFLPASTVYWSLANERCTYQKAKPGKARVARNFTVKASNILRDGAMHFVCHAPFIA